MSIFFTPLEVQPTPKPEIEPYEIQKYHSDPFQPTHIRIESLSDQRKKIMLWLKSMPVQTRVQKLTFTNKQFSCLLMSMHQRIQDRNNTQYEFAIFHDRLYGFRLVDDRLIRQPDQTRLLAEKRLVKSIVVVHRYTHFDSVTLDESLVSDVDKLFQLFDVIENGISHELDPISYKKYKKEDSTVFFYDSLQSQGITKSLGSWFVQIAKKNLSVKYFIENLQQNPCMPTEFVSKEQRIRTKFKLFKKYWKNLNSQEKQKIITKTLSKDISKIVGAYRQNIRLDDHTFPKILKSPSQEIDDFKFYIIHNNGEVLLKNLMFTHLNGTPQSLSVYKYELMVDLQEIFEKKEEEIPTPFSKKKSSKEDFSVIKPQVKIEEKIITSNQVFSQNLSNEKKLQTVHPSQEISPKTPITNNLKQQAASEKDIYINGKKLPKKEKKKNGNKNNKVTFKIDNFQYEEQESQFCQEEMKEMSEATNDRQESQQSENSRIASNQRFLEEELSKINKQIEQQTSAWVKYRQLALNRIHDVLRRYNLSFRVFGSHSSGLAIPSSDLDISIDPTIVNYFIVSFKQYRDKIIMALEFLRDIFRQTSWAAKFNLVSTAVVPVLMFEINLGIPYGDPREQTFNLSRRKQIIVQVDFTIQLYVNMAKDINPHMGYESTILIKQWVGQSPLLSTVIILFKHLLNKFNLNKVFTGGISSFALVALICAFYRISAPEKCTDIYSFMSSFSSFLAEFSEQKFIVNMADQEPIQEKKLKDKKLTVLNPLNNKNLTENSFKFLEVKNLMRELSEILSPKELQSQKQSKKNLRNLFFN